MHQRFTDKNHRLSDFHNEVWVHCSSCKKQAITLCDIEIKKAKLTCNHCGLSKIKSISSFNLNGNKQQLILPAHAYFKVELWFSHAFKNDTFWAYNKDHLNYLDQYIRATIREHKDRSHFTLLEKLPKFYHEAKNREALLKIIDKLRKK